MKLTKRDKTLLSFLAVLIILAVFGLLIIMPQWKKMGTIQKNLEAAEQKVDEMQMEIAQIPANTTILETEERRWAECVELMYPMTESYELERMITAIALESGLTAKDFLISTKPRESRLYPYYISELAVAREMADLSAAQEAASVAEPKDTSESEDEGQRIIFSSKIQVSVLGKRENMEQMIDRIYQEYPSIRVTDYEIKSEKVLTESKEVTDLSELTLGLEIYMCNK